MPAFDPIDAQLRRLIDLEERGAVAEDTTHRPKIKARWLKNPYAWARERLGINIKSWRAYNPQRYANHTWDGTREPLYTLAQAVAAGKHAAVASATGVGKTFNGALLVFWFLDCFEDSLVVTIAPKQEQLSLHIWKEIGRMWPKFQKLHPNATLDTLRIRMRKGRDDWGAVGFVCGVASNEEVANRARGFHAEHMLMIFEETTGIDTAIQKAFEVTCTAPHNLRVYFGNPDHDQDPLAMVMRNPAVTPIRASALDHPNVVCDDHTLIPGGPSTTVLAQWRADPNMGEDSPMYQSRARGIAPGQAADALIRADWIDACMSMTDDEKMACQRAGDGVPALGYDVAASANGDDAATVFGRGAMVIEIKARKCPDPGKDFRDHIHPMIVSGMIKKSARIGYDSVGVGIGAQTEAKRLGTPMTPLNGGARQWEQFLKNGEQFNNLRSQMYWQARTDIAHRRVSIPRDLELRADLCAPMWRTMNGKIIVESKESFRGRLGRSPNKGDAFVYWNWIRQRAMSLGAIDALPAGGVAF